MNVHVPVASGRASGGLAAYFALAFGITWSLILAFVASRSFRFDSFSLTDGLVIFSFMCVGPSTAGLLVTALTSGRAGFRDLAARIRRWRAAPRMWAIALFTDPLITIAVLVTLGVVVSSAFLPDARFIGLFIGLMAGALEEIGWTGFATPRLLERYRPLVAGLVLGLIWAMWHAFADFTGNIAAKGPEGWVLWFVTYWLIPLTGYRVLMTWVYSHTKSVLVAMAMHASWTGWQFFLTPASTTQAQDVIWHLLLSVGIWTAVLLVVVRPALAAGASWRAAAAGALQGEGSR